ncbi:MAG: pyridoxal-dependent decarboxylase [Actinomycetota bacterium]|nr:pyridoxal-dependent decarboxylase [Actinomycetota bacterium]MDA8207912.1 pyridoxal-dependent decarboxylase [Actinomycetota bacterium]
MHEFDEAEKKLATSIIDYALNRIAMEPIPLDGPATPQELHDLYGPNITEKGLGGEEALKRFASGYALATMSTDHPRFWAFVPVAPTKAATLFDLVVSASCISGSTWIEAAGAIYLENEALAWLSSLAGMPEGAGGTFVSGGSAGNLSGLVAGREKYRRLGRISGRPALLTSRDAHSSVATAARITDIEVFLVDGDEKGKLTGEALRRKWAELSDADRARVFGVASTAGVTNTGIVDNLVGVAEFCTEHDLWMHVDGAYGGAGLTQPELRELYNGIERADSFVIDPHKWLFAPFDCAAIIYRDPSDAERAMTQEAAYLDDVNKERDWNPASFAYHLSRRVRGLPFWFSLATYGTDAYRDAIAETLKITSYCADQIRQRPYLELAIEPELSVVVFRRKGWADADYVAWSEKLLDEQIAFVQPTTYRGERMMRFCFVNPRTSRQDVNEVLDTMAD